MTTSGRTEQEGIRELLHIALHDPHGMAAMLPADLDLTIRLLRRLRLLGTVAYRLEDAGLPGELPAVAQDQFRSAQVLAESRARLALWELDRIAHTLLKSTDVKCVVMKGCAFILSGLPAARGRIFADVDLMFAESELDEAEAVLNERGWQSQRLTPYDQNYYRKWTHELPPVVHIEREVEIDLHHNILPRTSRLKPDGEKLLLRSRRVPDTDYYVLGDEDLVLHAITHLMFNDDLADKLRELVDIDALLRHFTRDDEQFWQRLTDRAEELDLTRPVFYGLRYLRRFGNGDVPDIVIERTHSWRPPAPALWLMDRLVPRALFPPHPDLPSRLTDACRLLLYMRSHWIRMPPWLLAYHLSYKFWARRFDNKPRNA